MALQGKGFFTWKIPNCENGDPSAIANVARHAELSHVLIKVADGTVTYNGTWGIAEDLVTPVIRALRARDIEVWGWHYVYGDNPLGEAHKAIQRIRQYNLDGYVIDAEAEYKQDGKKSAAKKFMRYLRAELPSLPIALSSYRFPSYHPQLPWREFLEGCTYNMPQVYWMKAHNAGEQLLRCVREFQAMSPSRPVIPTGAAFREHGWQSTTEEVVEFMQTAKRLNLRAVNFWEWSDARSGIMPDVWEAIRDYSWSSEPKPQDICEAYIEALNTHDTDKILDLYAPNAVRITAASTIQGQEAIGSWYTQFLEVLLPQATFTLSGFTGEGNSRHMNWTAVSEQGRVDNGSSTFGLIEGKISYHYCFFSITE